MCHFQQVTCSPVVCQRFVKSLAYPVRSGVRIPLAHNKFLPSQTWENWGATWHPVIGPCVTLGLARTADATTQSLPSHLPCHPPYNPVTCHVSLPHVILSYCHVSVHTAMSSSVQSSHLPMCLPHHPVVCPTVIRTTTCPPVIGPRHCTDCHVSSVQ
jgi:hypothetical protein